MIISHRHRFIFIKTKKTAGTSIEIALSRICGPDDVITPIAIREDERKRQEMGGRAPQNYHIPLRYYRATDWLGLIGKFHPKQFRRHAPARFVRENIAPDVWNGYFKFCFERNPFDKAVSRYYWSTRGSNPRPDIDDYLDSVPAHRLSNWDLYAIDGEIALDFVGRFENLAEDLAKVKKAIGFSEELSLPKAKGNFRLDRRPYTEILGPRSRARIERVCAREITAFAYAWQDGSAGKKQS